MTVSLLCHRMRYCSFRALIIQKQSKDVFSSFAFLIPERVAASVPAASADATDAPHCRTSVENLITASLVLDGVGTVAKHVAPSGALNNCLLGPHRGPVQLNSDIFPSVYYSEVPPPTLPSGTKAFQRQTRTVWVLTRPASQCGHCLERSPPSSLSRMCT